MAGVTDLVYRRICRGMGCELTVTEMVSAKGLCYGSGRTGDLLATDPADRPCSFQLFGREPNIMADAARRAMDAHPGEIAYIDINMGCPAPKITGNGEGAALMKEPLLAAKIVETVAAAVPLPVSVKLRKGWDEGHVNAPELARMLEAAGAKLLSIHGRTRRQMYAGDADWDVVGEVKAGVAIPVVGNGDVFTGEDALRLVQHTGCDGVMVGRGALGNPWIFREIAAARAGQGYAPPHHRERIAQAVAHLREHAQAKGPKALPQMRKHLAWYIGGLPGANKIKARVNACEHLEALAELLFEYAEALDKR